MQEPHAVAVGAEAHRGPGENAQLGFLALKLDTALLECRLTVRMWGRHCLTVAAPRRLQAVIVAQMRAP